MGQTQSIQCAVMRHATAVGRCHVCPLLTNTCLVNPPIDPDIGYPVDSVIKKWFSCQRNQPFQEDVSYCLSCLFFIIPTLVQSKTPFSDPPMSCRTLCWPPNCHWLVTVLPQGNVRLQLFFTAFLMLVGGAGEGDGKIVEIIRAASSGESVIAVVCAWEHGSLLISSRNWGHLSWTRRWSLCRDIIDHH